MLSPIIALAVAGAAPTPPTKTQFTELEKTAIKDAVGRTLADPFSAQYEWQQIRSETLYCGWVNAKNRYGAYTGYTPFMILYYVGDRSKQVSVRQVVMEDFIVNKMCLDNGYSISR